MEKIIVEFINTCPCCDEYSKIVKSAGEKYGDKVETKIYYAGKDFDYLKKYGMITKGTLIINEKKKIDKLSRTIIEKAIADALEDIK